MIDFLFGYRHDKSEYKRLPVFAMFLVPERIYFYFSYITLKVGEESAYLHTPCVQCIIVYINCEQHYEQSHQKRNCKIVLNVESAKIKIGVFFTSG